MNHAVAEEIQVKLDARKSMRAWRACGRSDPKAHDGSFVVGPYCLAVMATSKTCEQKSIH